MDSAEIEIIVTNLKRRHSGVSSTILALLPWQRKLHAVAYLGTPRPPSAISIGWWRALTASFAKPPPGKSCRVWHVRRDHEMIIALLVRWLSGAKIKIVFTSAAQRFHGRFVRWITGKMDAVVATSTAAASFCHQASAVVGHGVDCEKFHPVADRAKWWSDGKLPGKLGIGVFGRVREEKGIDVFVDALLQVLPGFPDATALIVGECLSRDQLFKNGLMKKIREAGLAHRFVWTGYVPSEEMHLWYQKTSIAVACPRYEGYGLTLFEAAACGCAVIGSKTGAFPLLIDEGQNGFLTTPGEVSSLASALKQLLSDKALIEKFSRAIRDKVVHQFSVEQEARELGKVYDALLK